METVGRFTTVVGAAIGVFALVLGVRSIPDIKRYLKMRQM